MMKQLLITLNTRVIQKLMQCLHYHYKKGIPSQSDRFLRLQTILLVYVQAIKISLA